MARRSGAIRPWGSAGPGEGRRAVPARRAWRRPVTPTQWVANLLAPERRRHFTSRSAEPSVRRADRSERHVEPQRSDIRATQACTRRSTRPAGFIRGGRSTFRGRRLELHGRPWLTTSPTVSWTATPGRRRGRHRVGAGGDELDARRIVGGAARATTGWRDEELTTALVLRRRRRAGRQRHGHSAVGPSACGSNRASAPDRRLRAPHAAIRPRAAPAAVSRLGHGAGLPVTTRIPCDSRASASSGAARLDAAPAIGLRLLVLLRRHPPPHV